MPTAYTLHFKREAFFIESNGFRTAGKMIMDRGDGNKTVMQITSFKPEMGLNEEIFSKSFLIKI